LLFLPADAPESLGIEADNLERIDTEVSLSNPLKSVVFEEFALPRRLKGARVDLYYSPSFLLPAFKSAAVEINCVHDLAWRILPSSKSVLFRTYMNRRLPAALKRATRIVCVSDSTRKDVLKHYGTDLDERVRVVHNGVDLERYCPAPADSPDEMPFVAVVGNYDPRKNIQTLLEAFPTFRARMRPCRLVMVGPGEPQGPRPPAVDFLGYLDEPELASLYRRALMVVQPSIYEGFGLPVLEAMACGTAVACADIPVFREIAADAAHYFDPFDASSIARAMDRLARDEALRVTLARRGIERAQGFSWDETGRKLLAVFAEAVS
ncbi:MAG: glycosyltransferase family 4 protein, partial [Planctomycetota bacterium]|nr:glycosyltransferase family 4 protein [Planctomycetota bacterium]